MKIELNELGQTEYKRLNNGYQRMVKLIAVLEDREMPDNVQDEILVKVANLNAFTGTEKEYARELERAHNYVMRILLEKLNWVPKDFYRSQWMALGLSVFGLPLGVALGAVLDNMAFMAVFMPIGMVIGMGIGSGMDKKAAEEGRVLEL